MKKFEPPRDYGDVVTATNAPMVSSPDDIEENVSHGEEEEAQEEKDEDMNKEAANIEMPSL